MAAGAISTGEFKLLKKGFYQYQAIGDTMGKARKYFAESMRRSGIDPNYTGGAGRESMLEKNEKQIKILKSFADAKAAKGDYGPQYMMEQVEQMQALADHPWLRMGNRLMQATDGFVQSVIGNIEARGRAWDMVDTNKIDADVMDDIAQKYYNQIWKFDPEGRPIISDEAVWYASGEIALNLDSAANNAVSSDVRHCLLYTSPSPRDRQKSRMPSSA